MDLYSIALFVHLIGLIALFGALVLIQQVGARLRGAATWDDARTLLSVMQPTRGMFMAATVFLVVSGVYMALRRWSMTTPWIVVALVGLVLFVILGSVVVGRNLASIGRAAMQQSGPLPESMRALLTRPGLWGSIFGMNGGAMGIVWLMTTKPGWIGSIAVVLGLTLAGFVVGHAVAGRSQGASARCAQPSSRLAHGSRS